MSISERMSRSERSTSSGYSVVGVERRQGTAGSGLDCRGCHFLWPPRRCSSMVERQLPKLDTRVRFSSPAPNCRDPGHVFPSGVSAIWSRVTAGNREEGRCERSEPLGRRIPSPALCSLPSEASSPRDGSRHRLCPRWSHPRPRTAHTIVRGTHATLCCSPPTPTCPVKGVPSAHSAARLAYPWASFPSKVCRTRSLLRIRHIFRVRVLQSTPGASRPSRPAASVLPGRVRPAPSGDIAPQVGENAAARRERCGSARTLSPRHPCTPISPVKVGQLSSQLRQGRPTRADPAQFT